MSKANGNKRKIKKRPIRVQCRGISLKKKMKIIHAFNGGASKYSLAKENDVTPSTIRGIIQNQETIIEAFTAGTSAKTKRIRHGFYPDIENETVEWIRNKRQIQKTPVSKALAMKKATKIARAKGVNGFMASGRWMSNVAKRNGLIVHKVSGEAADVDVEALKLWRELELYPSFMNFEPDDVYNADEFALYWEALPDKSYDFKNALIAGKKVSKARVTALACCNLTGNDKQPLLVIGSAKKPHCFNNNRIPLPYTSSKKAWMNSYIFTEWLIKWDRQLDRNILLFVDNFSAHDVDLNFHHITLKFLPANTTSLSQPLDQGIINSLKDKYRYKLLEDRIERLDSNNNNKFQLIHGLRLLNEAWEEVTQETIRNCFRHAEFRIDPVEEDEDIINDLQNIFEDLRFRENNDVDLEDYLDIDAYIEPPNEDQEQSDEDEDQSNDDLDIAQNTNGIEWQDFYMDEMNLGDQLQADGIYLLEVNQDPDFMNFEYLLDEE